MSGKQAFEVRLDRQTVETIIDVLERKQEAKKRGAFAKERKKLMRVLENYDKVYQFVNLTLDELSARDDRQTAEWLAIIGDDIPKRKMDGLIAKLNETRRYLYFINAALEVMRDNAKTNGDATALRQYNILVMRYIVDEPASVKEIMQAENISERTFYRDTAEAVNTLVYLVLGIDGVEYDTSKTTLD